MKISFNNILFLILLVVFAYILYKVASFFSKNKDKVNPFSDQNLAYQGVNKIVQSATGDTNATLGTKIYDWVDSVAGWFGKSDADKQKAASEQYLKEIQAKKDKSLNASPVMPMRINIPYSQDTGEPIYK